MPYRNPFGMTYDSGDYHAVMEHALTLGEWNGFASRRAEARTRGKLPRHRCRQLRRNSHGRAARARRDDRPARRRGGAGHRHRLAGPGARDQLRATRHRMARRADRQRAPGDRRYGPGAWPAVARIPAAHCGSAASSCATPRARSSTRPRASPSMLLEVGATELTFADGAFSVDRHRPRASGCSRWRARRIRAQRSAGRVARPAGRDQRRDHARRQLPVRLPGVRGGDRCRHRRGADRPLRRGGRRRACGQPDDRAWPGARRHRAGCRPGVMGTMPSTIPPTASW